MYINHFILNRIQLIFIPISNAHNMQKLNLYFSITCLSPSPNQAKRCSLIPGNQTRLNRPFKSPLLRTTPNSSKEAQHVTASPSTPSSSLTENVHSLKRTRASSSTAQFTPREPKRVKLLTKMSPQSMSLDDLRKRETELDEEIGKLQAEGLVVEELDHQIDRLHRYNDIKDAAQIVMGRLAELTGVTVKSLHLKYDLPLRD